MSVVIKDWRAGKDRSEGEYSSYAGILSWRGRAIGFRYRCDYDRRHYFLLTREDIPRPVMAIAKSRVVYWVDDLKPFIDHYLCCKQATRFDWWQKYAVEYGDALAAIEAPRSIVLASDFKIDNKCYRSFNEIMWGHWARNNVYRYYLYPSKPEKINIGLNTRKMSGGLGWLWTNDPQDFMMASLLMSQQNTIQLCR